MTENQHWFLTNAESLSYKTVICYSAKEAISAIQAYYDEETIKVLLRIYRALKRKIKPIASAVVNHIKLILIGLCIVGLIALLSGCASAPICPEIKVTFCPK